MLLGGGALKKKSAGLPRAWTLGNRKEPMILCRLLFAGVLISAAAQASVILDNTYVFGSRSDLGTVDVEVIVEDNYLGNPNLRNWTYAVHNVDFVPTNHGFPTVPRGFILPWAPELQTRGCPPPLPNACGFEIDTPPGWNFSYPFGGAEFRGAWTAFPPSPGLPVGSTVEFGFATTSQGIVHRSQGGQIFSIDFQNGGPGDSIFGDIDIPTTPPTPFPASIPEPSTFVMLGATLSLAVLIGRLRMPRLIKRVANRSRLAVRSNR